jgi:hypothetical protein
MPSKTTKNRCPYIFIQGAKKGKRCNAKCVKKFCKFHTPKTKAKKIQYYNDKKNEKENTELNKYISKINSITNIDNLPDLDKLTLIKMNFNANAIYIRKKIGGIDIFLGKDEAEITKDILDMQYGHCNCEEIQSTKIIISETEFENFLIQYKNDFIYDLVQNWRKDNNDTVRIWNRQIDNFESKYEYDKCINKKVLNKTGLKQQFEDEWMEYKKDNLDKFINEYKKYQKEMNESIKCKRCIAMTLPKIYFNYKGKSKDMAEKKLQKLYIKYDDNRRKYILHKKMLEVVTKRYNELSNE